MAVLPGSIQIFLAVAGKRSSSARWQYYLTAFRSYWQEDGLALPDSSIRYLTAFRSFWQEDGVALPDSSIRYLTDFRSFWQWQENGLALPDGSIT
jgi:hypothetical protein